MRSFVLTISTAVALSACNPDPSDTVETGDTNETGDTSDTSSGPCTATVTQLLPFDGSLGVGVEEELEVWFSEAVSTGDVEASLTDEGGTAQVVSVELAGDGLSALIGHPPLAESTTYTLTVDTCEAVATSVFTTTAGPVDEEIEHGTYALDYDDVEIASPAWASALSSMLPLEYLLVEILDVDLALQEIDGVGAIGFYDETYGIYQGRCYDPMIYDNIDFSENPTFVAGPSDLHIPQGNLTLYDLRIQAAFSDGGSELVGIDITGQVDARQILANVDIDACAFAELAGDSCIPCESDGQAYCIDMWLVANEAPFVPGLDIDEDYVAADDSACW
jgi:hypothetical protein